MSDWDSEDEQRPLRREIADLTSQLAWAQKEITALRVQLAAAQKEIEELKALVFRQNDAEFNLLSENSALKARCERMEKAIKMFQDCTPYWDYSDDLLEGTARSNPKTIVAAIASAQLAGREALRADEASPASFTAETKAAKELEKKARIASEDWDLKCEDGKGKLSDMADALAELDRVRAVK